MSGKHITVPESVYKKGCVTTVEEAIKSASQIGYPVMIKASEGGGGKGIRKVESPEEFHAVFRQVCSYRNPTEGLCNILSRRIQLVLHNPFKFGFKYFLHAMLIQPNFNCCLLLIFQANH